MLKKLATAALLSSIFLASCKKKEVETTSPTSYVAPDQQAIHNDSLPHVCIDKELSTSQQRVEAAIYTSTQWTTGQTIRIKFLNGDAILQNRVKNAAANWLNFANLKFQYVTAAENADIKIAFKYNGDAGSWSYMGTDCKYIAQNKPSMNFGWFTSSTSDMEISRTVLHEYGHALGLVHEQSSPAANINWNKEAVYAYYTGAPNYWTRESVDHNVFFKYSSSVVTNYTAYDRLSIMQYSVPASFTTDGVSVGNNAVLSETDKYFIGQRYPFSSTKRTILYPGEKITQSQFLTSPDDRLKLTLQTDGNLVLFKSGNQPIWSSNTAGKPVISQLIMQNDGNLVLYDNAFTPYWYTGTHLYKGAFLMLENSGSATLYQNGVKRWSTNTKI